MLYTNTAYKDGTGRYYKISNSYINSSYSNVNYVNTSVFTNNTPDISGLGSLTEKNTNIVTSFFKDTVSLDVTNVNIVSDSNDNNIELKFFRTNNKALDMFEEIIPFETNGNIYRFQTSDWVSEGERIGDYKLAITAYDGFEESAKLDNGVFVQSDEFTVDSMDGSETQRVGTKPSESITYLLTDKFRIVSFSNVNSNSNDFTSENINNIQENINKMREEMGLPLVNYTDSLGVNKIIQKVHIKDMRSKASEVFTALRKSNFDFIVDGAEFDREIKEIKNSDIEDINNMIDELKKDH